MRENAFEQKKKKLGLKFRVIANLPSNNWALVLSLCRPFAARVYVTYLLPKFWNTTLKLPEIERAWNNYRKLQGQLFSIWTLLLAHLGQLGQGESIRACASTVGSGRRVNFFLTETLATVDAARRNPCGNRSSRPKVISPVNRKPWLFLSIIRSSLNLITMHMCVRVCVLMNNKTTKE